MLELTHLALLFCALATAKIGLDNRGAELIMFLSSMVFFAAFAFGSFGVQKSFSSGTVDQPGMFVIGLGGTLVMLAFSLLAAIERLPVVGGDGSADASGIGRRVKRLLRGNNRL